MANDTSTRSGGASSAQNARRPKRADRPPPGRTPTSAVVNARTEAQRIRKEAETDAARIRAEAEEHARGLVLDARQSADGVRAEGMELVSNLREMSDVLRSNAEILLRDIQAIHSRMVGELEGARPGDADSASGGEAAPEGEAASGADTPGGDHVLEVPDFVSRG